MSGQDPSDPSKVALFRYKVIVTLRRLEPRTPEFARELKALSERRWKIPGSSRQRIASQTIRSWLAAYERFGLKGLEPKPRRDRGRSRSLPLEAVETILEIKRDRPHLTTRAVIEEALSQGLADQGIRLPHSTVHRLLAAEGLTGAAAPEPTDRRRFAFANAGDMTLADVMHGPKVPEEPGQRRRRKTYLIALIDDATRVITRAEFRFSETSAEFLQVMKTAVRRRGIPLRLFVDNGSSFRSHQLAMICARLDIQLIHSRPRSPESRGKIERFFRTCRGQLVSRLTEAQRDSLETLNSQLHGWIEQEYHTSPHRGLDNMTPFDKWTACSEQVRYCPLPDDLDDIFLQRHQRRVARDRTVRLNNRIYEVDAGLIGQTVTLAHDPAAPTSRPLRVEVDGKPAGLAHPLDATANAYRFDDGPGVTFRRRKS